MLSDFKPAAQEAGLEAMFAEIASAGPLFRPSKLWDRLAREHAREIDKYGLGQLKKTLGMRYFNFALPGIMAQSLLPAFRDWLRRPTGNPLAARMVEDREAPPELKYAGAIGKLYAVYVELLYDQTAARDGERLLERIEDPAFGGPHLVRLSSGKRTSQDLCNSLYEFYSVTRGNGALGTARPIIELGAGYGRLAYIILHARPACKYWIVDLPPALYTSQQYLSTVLPDRNVFAFRHFDDYREVASEVEKAHICFFTANQIRLLPDKIAAAFIAVSNLHEMRREQIDFYFDQIDRLTRGVFYSKQWLSSRSTKEEGFVVRQGEYPVKPTWQTLYDERHPFQTWFFHALYAIR